MNNFFKNAEIYTTDAYLMDYSHQTHSKRGVEIHPTKPIDIDAMHLHNPSSLKYWVVNFEQHDDFFKQANGLLVSNCEAMLAAQGLDMPWMLLVELKYGKEKNAKRNTKEAKDQLLDTLDYLVEKHVVTHESHNFYLNSSAPAYDTMEPFLNFKQTQTARLEVLRSSGYKIRVLGYNNLLIVSNRHISIPRVNI